MSISWQLQPISSENINNLLKDEYLLLRFQEHGDPEYYFEILEEKSLNVYEKIKKLIGIKPKLPFLHMLEMEKNKLDLQFSILMHIKIFKAAHNNFDRSYVFGENKVSLKMEVGYGVPDVMTPDSVIDIANNLKKYVSDEKMVIDELFSDKLCSDLSIENASEDYLIKLKKDFKDIVEFINMCAENNLGYLVYTI